MKKNKIIAVALLAILGITAFVACKKANNDKPEELTVHTKMSASRNLCDPVVKSSPFFLNDKDIDKQVELAADMHNEYLEYFYQSAVKDGIKQSSPDYDNYFREISKKFFEGKGIVLEDNSYYSCMKTIDPDENVEYLAESFSEHGKQIFENVLTNINSFDVMPREDFNNKMNDLYAECNSIDENESVSLKLMIKVGLKSLEYWEANLQKWSDHFGKDVDNSVMVKRGNNTRPTNKEILKAAGSADLKGAIRGAVGGGLGAGPAGAVAGGLVVGGTFSAARIIAGAIFHWW